MNHLVISVSKDSSLELLGKYADVIVLDKEPMPTCLKSYTSVYIRSHFSTPELSPQNFRDDIQKLVTLAKTENPNLLFVDAMSTVDAIIEFEDKWNQYEKFSEFMPLTKMLNSMEDVSEFARPIFKKRLSSRGAGVTWDRQKTEDSTNSWIVQESLDIQEELRVYSILGKVYPVGVVKQSMSEGDKAQSVDSRILSQDEIDFSSTILQQCPSLDIVGIDTARSLDGKLSLMEVNRSPGFAKFFKHTGVNLADIHYKGPDNVYLNV